ncbi:MAG: GFA family protein, partial [Pseudomonadota bacterium]
MTASGSCLCGEVKFTATPAEKKVGVCHCDICRTQTAGPFFGIDCGDSLEIEDTPFLGIYRSSEWAERGFCKKCGTVLFWRTHDHSSNIVSVNTLQ